MKVAWDERGLAPAIAVDASDGTALMLAWCNAEALARTLATHEAHFWSRSRQALWRKGETSGHVLRVREVRLDCDGDALLYLCDPAGPVCHTGKRSCFHFVVKDDDWLEDDGPAGVPASIVDRVAATIEARKASTAARSYTRSLLDAGWPMILAKLAEEERELAAELPTGERKAVVHEAADLLFHALVGLAARDIPVAEVWAELARRFGTSGHAEKAARPPK